MYLEDLLYKCQDAITRDPSLRERIQDLYEMACEEVESGGSENNEVELALEQLEDIS